VDERSTRYQKLKDEYLERVETLSDLVAAHTALRDECEEKVAAHRETHHVKLAEATGPVEVARQAFMAVAREIEDDIDREVERLHEEESLSHKEMKVRIMAMRETLRPKLLKATAPYDAAAAAYNELVLTLRAEVETVREAYAPRIATAKRSVDAAAERAAEKKIQMRRILDDAKEESA
jgi:hypothetical protein